MVDPVRSYFAPPARTPRTPREARAQAAALARRVCLTAQEATWWRLALWVATWE